MKIKNILILRLLPIIYLFTRLVNLKIIPIFTDEAIYSYWAQVALHDPAHRFISLTDGKQPLFIWLAAISQHFIADPLIASRLVSVFAGLGSLLAIYLRCKTLFNKRTAQVASILYIILPFTLLYDRMALFDSLLTMFGLFVILFSIKLVKEPRLDTAFLAGFSIGFAAITKSSGFFFLYLLPFSLLFFDIKSKDLKLRFVKWAILSILVVFISMAMYNALRLSPLFYIIDRKNLEFIRSFSEVINHPFLFFYSNVKALISWTASYLTWPLFVIFVIGLFIGIAKKNISALYLFILIAAPFLTEAFFNKILYPRFILFYFPYIIILTSYAVISIFEKLAKFRKYLILAVILIMIQPLQTSFKLITNPPSAKLPSSDAGQYLNDWPAGYGVNEVVNVLKQESKEKDVYIGTEGTFGLYPFALNIYFYGNSKVHILSYWPVDPEELPSQIMDIAKDNKTYFVFNFTQKEITNPHLKFFAKYQKGKGNSYMRLYEIIIQE